MKLIVAIIRPEKLNDVLEALFRADVRGLTVAGVQGHGGEMEQVETYRAAEVTVEADRSWGGRRGGEAEKEKNTALGRQSGPLRGCAAS